MPSTAAHQPEPRGKRAALAAAELAETGRVDIINDRIRVVVIGDVDRRQPDGPFALPPLDSLFACDVEVPIIRKTRLVRLPDDLVLRIHNRKWEARSVFEEVTEQQPPDSGLRRSMRHDAVRCIPCQPPRTLRPS